MGSTIRKGSKQHKMIERRMQAFFSDPENATIDPESGQMVVKDPDTFRRAADYVSGRVDPEEARRMDPTVPHMFDRMSDD